MRVISLGAHDLELRIANKRATSLPGDDETEYRTDINKLLDIWKMHLECSLTFKSFSE